MSTFASECLKESMYTMAPNAQKQTYACQRYEKDVRGCVCFEYTLLKQTGVTAEEIVLLAAYLDLENDMAPSPLLGMPIREVGIIEQEQDMQTIIRILVVTSTQSKLQRKHT